MLIKGGYGNNKAKDIATKKSVVLKATCKLVIDTAGTTKSHWLVTDIAGVTGLLLTPSSYRLIVATYN